MATNRADKPPVDQWTTIQVFVWKWLVLSRFRSMERSGEVDVVWNANLWKFKPLRLLRNDCERRLSPVAVGELSKAKRATPSIDGPENIGQHQPERGMGEPVSQTMGKS